MLIPGQKAFVLCGRVDPFGNDEPAIEYASLSWMPVTVRSIEPDEDGAPGAWLVLDDGSHAWYDLKFISENMVLPLPRTE